MKRLIRREVMDMKKISVLMVALILAILAIVPVMSAHAENANTASYTMYVSSSNGKGVRMRSGASTDSDVLFNLGEGRPVTVTGAFGDWSIVRVSVNGKSYNGYIMSQFLSSTDPSTLPQTFKPVSRFAIRVRAASADGVVSMWKTTNKQVANKMRDLTRTETLTVIQESRAWYLAEDMYGNVGYVAKAYVTAC